MINKTMIEQIFHSRDAESAIAKARWFQSLSLPERMDIFTAYTDLILDINPKIMELKRAEPVEGRIRVVSKT